MKDFKDLYNFLFLSKNHIVKAIKGISNHRCPDPVFCCVQGNIDPGYSGVRRLWLSSLFSME